MSIHDQELPPTNIDPFPSPALAVDYRDVIKKCDGILERIQKLKADLAARAPFELPARPCAVGKS